MPETTGRLPFEIDQRTDPGRMTAHAGVPLVVETFRASGAAAAADRALAGRKKKGLGLMPSQMVEALIALVVAGGDCCEDFERLRQDMALATLLDFLPPAPQTFRDFLETFHDPGVQPLWQGPKAVIQGENQRLLALRTVVEQVVAFAHERLGGTSATLDIDATILESHKRAALPTYKGCKGYQPVMVLWAELGQIVADEFRDGNVPAGAANRFIVGRAIAVVRRFVDQVFLRADSALYDHEVLDLLESENVLYAVTAEMSPALAATIARLPETAWQDEEEDGDALRSWAEVVFVPDDGDHGKDRPVRRYVAVRLAKKPGHSFADGSTCRHFAVVSNRWDLGGQALLHWHRAKAGTIERAHDVLTNDLAGEALPSQKFGANAAWLRLNIIAFNTLAAFQRLGLPEELHTARLKRLRFVLFNTVGRVVEHGRETLVRWCSEAARRLAAGARLLVWTPVPPAVARRLWAT